MCLGTKVRKKIQLFSHLEENLLERTHFEVLMSHQSVIMPLVIIRWKSKDFRLFLGRLGNNA